MLFVVNFFPYGASSSFTTPAATSFYHFIPIFFILFFLLHHPFSFQFLPTFVFFFGPCFFSFTSSRPSSLSSFLPIFPFHLQLQLNRVFDLFLIVFLFSFPYLFLLLIPILFLGLHLQSFAFSYLKLCPSHSSCYSCIYLLYIILSSL